MCAKFQGDQVKCLCFMAIFAKCEKSIKKEKINNFVTHILKMAGNFPSNLAVDSPIWLATLQQIWFFSDKGSQT